MQSINAVAPILPSHLPLVHPSIHPSIIHPFIFYPAFYKPLATQDPITPCAGSPQKAFVCRPPACAFGRPVSYQITIWVGEGACLPLPGHEDRLSGRAEGGGCWNTELDLIPEIGVILSSAAVGASAAAS